MEKNCASWRPLLGALADRELSALRVEELSAHVRDCPVCAAELEATRTLKRRLGSLELPGAPRAFRPSRPAWRYIPGTAAAALLVALLVLALPGALPELVARTSRLHDDYVTGRGTPEALGLRFLLPPSVENGACPCPPSLASTSPFIVYRKNGELLSLLLSEAPSGLLPESARRTHDGFPYYAFRSGRNTAIVSRSGEVSYVWISRLDEAAMLAALLDTVEGKTLFSDGGMSLQGLTCRACCAFVESRGEGDLANMELVVRPDGRRVDVSRIISTLRDSGYTPREAK